LLTYDRSVNCWGGCEAGWAKIGVFLPQEAPMPVHPTEKQLELFRPSTPRPRWRQLPTPVQRKTLTLLASLLRQTLVERREASDER